MRIINVLTMISGLVLFFLGWKLMEEGLSRFCNGRLEAGLEKLTAHPCRAVLTGAGVTALLQSSSAVTVMVVGFVNSGIMKLEQAVGIIMGANIGTTATAWLLGLTDIEGKGFLARLFHPASFTPALALLGAVLFLLFPKKKPGNLAVVLVGFSVLLFGMDTMSLAAGPLKDVPEFMGILTRFANPVLGLLAGLAFTAVIQSSSASIGILQALCATGALGYDAAIPILLGQNIGTCMTALLAAVGASRNAKRAALVHLYFNLFGAVLFLAAFLSWKTLFGPSFLRKPATRAGIALAHSLFNIAATICFLPFSRIFVKLAYLTVRDPKGAPSERDRRGASV